ncbi:MAG: TIM barrel protein [Planctomycetota bacterium]
MKLSLSGRLVESGNGTIISVREFLDLAGRHGYQAVDLRATQLNANTSEADLDAIRGGLAENKLSVFEGAFQGKPDGEGETAFKKVARIIADLGGEGIRVSGDLATLKKAARLAAPFGLRILYQMHTGGDFETIKKAVKSIAEIGEPNFGVMAEPANHLMAREKFNKNMFEPIKDHLFGVHVQTLEVRPDAESKLKLADGTEVRFTRVEYADNKQINFKTFFAALRKAGFDGYVNELEPCPGKEKLDETVGKAAAFLKPFLG